MLKDRAIGMLQRPLERKLSDMLGAQVTFGRLDASLLGGSVEAEDVTVIVGPDPAVPLLTIRKVRAEVSLAAALKKEFVVRSLTIEKPVVTIARDADGTLNLPQRVSQPSDTPADNAPADDSAGNWKLEAEKVLVVDGEVHFRDASGYHASVEQLLAEVKHAGDALEFTVIADAGGRRDEFLELGQVRANGRADNVPSLAQWSAASVRATIELADKLRARVDAPSLNPLDVKAELNGAVVIDELVRLLPSGLAAILGRYATHLRGRVEVLGRATYRAAEGLRVPELNLRAADVSVR